MIEVHRPPRATETNPWWATSLKRSRCAVFVICAALGSGRSKRFAFGIGALPSVLSILLVPVAKRQCICVRSRSFRVLAAALDHSPSQMLVFHCAPASAGEWLSWNDPTLEVIPLRPPELWRRQNALSFTISLRDRSRR